MRLSLRSIVFVCVVAVAVAAALLGFLPLFFFAQRSAHDTAVSFSETVSAKVLLQVSELLRDTQTCLGAIDAASRHWIALDRLDSESIFLVMQYIYNSINMSSSVYLDTGEYFNMWLWSAYNLSVVTPDRNAVVVASAGNTSIQQVTITFRNTTTYATIPALGTLTQNNTYNASSRPFFPAIRSRRTWSSAFVDVSGQFASLFAGMPLYSSTSQSYMGAIGIKLIVEDNIVFFLRDYAVAKTGRVLLLDARSRSFFGGNFGGLNSVVTLPGGGRRLAVLGDVQDAVVTHFLKVVTEDFVYTCAAPCVVNHGLNQLYLPSFSDAFFGRVEQLTDEYGLNMRAVVIIPATDFLDDVRTGGLVSIITVVVAVCCILMLVLVLIAKLMQPLRQLPAKLYESARFHDAPLVGSSSSNASTAEGDDEPQLPRSDNILSSGLDTDADNNDERPPSSPRHSGCWKSVTRTLKGWCWCCHGGQRQSKMGPDGSPMRRESCLSLDEVFQIEIAYAKLQIELRKARSFLPQSVLQQLDGNDDSSATGSTHFSGALSGPPQPPALTSTTEDVEDGIGGGGAHGEGDEGGEESTEVERQPSSSAEDRPEPVMVLPSSGGEHSLHARTSSSQNPLLSNSADAVNASNTEGRVPNGTVGNVSRSLSSSHSNDKDKATALGLGLSHPAADDPADPRKGDKTRQQHVSVRMARRSTGPAARGISVIPLSERRATIVVGNVNGFHKLVESYGPAVAQKRHAAMVDAVLRLTDESSGVLETFQGDHVNIQFNTSKTCANHAARAASVVVQLNRLLKSAQDTSVFAFRFGCATGTAFCGHLGSDRMRRFSVVGPLIGHAFALMQQTRSEGVSNVVNADLFDALQGDSSFVAQHVNFVVLPQAAEGRLISTLLDPELLERPTGNSGLTRVEISRRINEAFVAFSRGDLAGARSLTARVPREYAGGLFKCLKSVMDTLSALQ